MNTLAAHALQEALVAAARDGTERARAVGALRGAEVYVTTWPADPSALRTLLNSAGVRALALFTDERQLEDAAVRFAWLGVDGQVPTRRLHISEAIRFARQQHVSLVIVDITSDHMLELDEGEMELMSALPSTRPPSYAGLAPVVSTPRPLDAASDVQRVSSRPGSGRPTSAHPVSAHPSVRASSARPGSARPLSTRPPALDGRESEERISNIPSSALLPTAINVDVAHHAVSATFGLAQTATMTALAAAPADDLIDVLSAVLRNYPEVEWACLVGEADRDDPSAVHVAVRIAADFRKHLSEISVKLRSASAAQGAPCDVLVLDTSEQMKRARAIGLPFYPWRKR